MDPNYYVPPASLPSLFDFKNYDYIVSRPFFVAAAAAAAVSSPSEASLPFPPSFHHEQLSPALQQNQLRAPSSLSSAQDAEIAAALEAFEAEEVVLVTHAAPSRSSLFRASIDHQRFLSSGGSRRTSREASSSSSGGGGGAPFFASHESTAFVAADRAVRKHADMFLGVSSSISASASDRVSSDTKDSSVSASGGTNDGSGAAVDPFAAFVLPLAYLGNSLANTRQSVVGALSIWEGTVRPYLLETMGQKDKEREKVGSSHRLFSTATASLSCLQFEGSRYAVATSSSPSDSPSSDSSSSDNPALAWPKDGQRTPQMFFPSSPASGRPTPQGIFIGAANDRSVCPMVPRILHRSGAFSSRGGAHSHSTQKAAMEALLMDVAAVALRIVGGVSSSAAPPSSPVSSSSSSSPSSASVLQLAVPLASEVLYWAMGAEDYAVGRGRTSQEALLLEALAEEAGEGALPNRLIPAAALGGGGGRGDEESSTLAFGRSPMSLLYSRAPSSVPRPHPQLAAFRSGGKDGHSLLVGSHFTSGSRDSAAGIGGASRIAATVAHRAGFASLVSLASPPSSSAATASASSVAVEAIRLMGSAEDSSSFLGTLAARFGGRSRQDQWGDTPLGSAAAIEAVLPRRALQLLGEERALSAAVRPSTSSSKTIGSRAGNVGRFVTMLREGIAPSAVSPTALAAALRVAPGSGSASAGTSSSGGFLVEEELFIPIFEGSPPLRAAPNSGVARNAYSLSRNIRFRGANVPALAPQPNAAAAASATTSESSTPPPPTVVRPLDAIRFVALLAIGDGALSPASLAPSIDVAARRGERDGRGTSSGGGSSGSGMWKALSALAKSSQPNVHVPTAMRFQTATLLLPTNGPFRGRTSPFFTNGIGESVGPPAASTREGGREALEAYYTAQWGVLAATSTLVAALEAEAEAEAETKTEGRGASSFLTPPSAQLCAPLAVTSPKCFSVPDTEHSGGAGRSGRDAYVQFISGQENDQRQVPIFLGTEAAIEVVALPTIATNDDDYSSEGGGSNNAVVASSTVSLEYRPMAVSERPKAPSPASAGHPARLAGLIAAVHTARHRTVASLGLGHSSLSNSLHKLAIRPIGGAAKKSQKGTPPSTSAVVARTITVVGDGALYQPFLDPRSPHYRRLLCATYTYHKNFPTRAVEMHTQGGHLCDKHLLFTDRPAPAEALARLDRGRFVVVALDTPGGEDYMNMWQKTRMILAAVEGAARGLTAHTAEEGINNNSRELPMLRRGEGPDGRPLTGSPLDFGGDVAEAQRYAEEATAERLFVPPRPYAPADQIILRLSGGSDSKSGGVSTEQNKNSSAPFQFDSVSEEVVAELLPRFAGYDHVILSGDDVCLAMPKLRRYLAEVDDVLSVPTPATYAGRRGPSSNSRQCGGAGSYVRAPLIPYHIGYSHRQFISGAMYAMNKPAFSTFMGSGPWHTCSETSRTFAEDVLMGTCHRAAGTEGRNAAAFGSGEEVMTCVHNQYITGMAHTVHQTSWLRDFKRRVVPRGAPITSADSVQQHFCAAADMHRSNLGLFGMHTTASGRPALGAAAVASASVPIEGDAAESFSANQMESAAPAIQRVGRLRLLGG